MTSMLTPTPMTDAQSGPVAKTLARAFHDDPMPLYVFPDEAHRRAVLPGFFSVGVALGYRFGLVHVAGDGVDGAAVWLPPGVPEFTADDMAATGVRDREAEMGPEALNRFERVMQVWGELHARDMPAPHWYLMILGVDPPMQGRGIGGRLIAPVLGRADAEGMPCYLETAKERNVTFYRRHGFEVVVEDTMPGGGFRYWTMHRPPSARAT